MAERPSMPAGLPAQDAKQELLARLLAEEGLSARRAGILRRAPEEVPPLSHAQELLWLLDRAAPGLTAYNSALAFRLHGPLNLEALGSAFDALVARHEALRTRFGVRGEQPVQLVDTPAPAGLVIEDLRALPAESRGRDADARLRAHARRPFDLERDHLFRPVLLRLAENQSILLLLTHHIVTDAWSYGVMLRELSQLYAAGLEGRRPAWPEPALQFGDFAAWERRELSGERLRERLAYWRRELLPSPAELLVPSDRPRPAVASFEGGRAMLTLSGEELERIRGLTQSEGVTLYMALLAAYQLLLHRWSGQDDFVTGSAIAGRTRSETEDVIGYFSGALPLRARFPDGQSFRQLLAAVRARVLGTLEHQDIPIEALILELQQEGRPGHAPLFNAVLTMQDTIGAGLELPGLTVEPLEVEAGTTKFDLTLLPTERTSGLELLLWYRTDLFDGATANRFLGHFATVLRAATERPDTTVAELPLLTAQELAELDRWNATAGSPGSPATIAQLIVSAAARAPERAAVVSGAVTLTWGELIARASRIAHALQARGVGPDTPVGLCLERSADLITGMTGILLSGGAYLPLLPGQPAARLEQQARESGLPIVVTDEAHRGLLPPDVAAICLDDPALASLPSTPPPSSATPDSLAYVLFTSGSTGVPKGVAVTHANLVHYTRAVAARLGLDLAGSAEPWQCATVSTLAADLGHTSVFTALCSGGVLHVLPEALVHDAAGYREWSAAHPVDLLKITPSHFQALAGPDYAPEHLPRRWLVLGGEACPWSLANAVRAAGRCRVLNHYGPTETTVGATTFEPGERDVAPWAPATVPIGRPLPNVTTHVLDPHGQPAPVGVPGELWIGGQGVARGYLGRDDLTRERFITRDRERRYRTGDRVRRLPTGDLEFLGRFDTQVKIRGHRVELGEIEAVLAGRPGVRQAAVVLRDDALTGYLVAGPETTDPALAQSLGAVLPDYMVPTVWVRLERMPLNANGKVDRAALPAPQPARSAGDGAPRTDAERRMAVLWAEVLKRPGVGIHEDFFALGGHSLLAIRLLGRIAKTFGPRLPLRTLFDHPTIARLTPVVEPANPIEDALGALWAEVLKRDRVGRDENFFALGGHSLLAIRLLGKIAKTFGVRLPLRVLFEHPTVAELAERLEAEAAPEGSRP
jgi:amino acid adenylation domain-containing protein